MRWARLAVPFAALPLLLAASPQRKMVRGDGSAATVPPNLVAIHDPQSPGYNADCLSCHAEVLTRRSLDPRVSEVHQAMIGYTPGFNPRHGVTSAVCVQCHRATDTRDGSAAGLRVQVDRRLCALCHGPSGPGKPLYR